MAVGIPKPTLKPPVIKRPDPALVRRGEARLIQLRKSPAGDAVRDRVVSRAVARGIVSVQQAQEAFEVWLESGKKDTLWRTLSMHPEVDHEAVYAEAAKIYAFRPIDLNSEPPNDEAVKKLLELFPSERQEKLRQLRILPLERVQKAKRGGSRLLFATHDPTNPEILRFLHANVQESFDLCYAPESQIIQHLERSFQRRNEFLERLRSEEEAMDFGAHLELGETKKLVDEDALDAEINRSSLINLFEAALIESVRLDASDIHIWPRGRLTEIHMRIDGTLRLWQKNDTAHPEAFLAVVKDRCGNVDRFEREMAQDGFIQRDIDGTTIRYRVSVLPIASAFNDVRAESIVIRVLDDRRVFTDLSKVGLLPGALDRFNKAIRQPQGMVIMTGPTGSGKSTTLVAALHAVVKPEVNVLTVEDPVEYLIKNVRQIKLGARLDLEGALRAILRHDPDVVMVGEMRDKQTAELAIKLANTGHLTFSTLHTNDAPSAVSRLYKMGIEPFLIAYAINLVVAQRLLRRACPTCRKPDPDPDYVLIRELGFTEEEIEQTTFIKSGGDPGCPTCRGSGYKGRRAISEALYFSREIRHIIVESGDQIEEDAIREKAVEEGMLTLLASAREVVKQGDTTIEEIVRAIASDE